jgi:hypothetical protein
MRTTLSIDDDNAARLERLRKKREASLKEIVNEAIRTGLDRLEEPQPKKRKASPTKVVDLGAPLFTDVKELIGALDEDYDRKKLGLG